MEHLFTTDGLKKQRQNPSDGWAGYKIGQTQNVI